MSNIGTDAGLLFNINKPQYEIMEETFGDLEGRVKVVTFLVDSDKLFQGFNKEFTAVAAEKVFKEKDSFGVALEFFNWIIHWRRFFTKKGIATKFYIMHGSEDYVLQNVDSEWGSTPNGKYSKFIEFILEKRIRPIANACQNIFILNTNLLETKIEKARLPYFLYEHNFTKNNVMIITGGLMQMTPIYRLPKHHILRINNTTCNFIGRGKVFEYISKSYKTPISGIPDDRLPYFMGIMGDTDSGLTPLADSKVIRKSNLLKRLKDIPLTTDDSKLSDAILSEFKLDSPISTYRSELNKRVSAINNFATISLNKADELSLIEQISLTSPNWEELMNLNATYLNNALDIENLW
jgi:hypothetical protein